jgi:zinc protease
MFELVHLAFTGPRKDEGAFKSWQQRESERVRNRRMSPEVVFQEDMGLFLSRNHRRRQPTTPEVLEKVRLDRALATYQERFREAGDFTFVIVGNVEVAKVQPLVETYLASLPTVGRKEKWRDIGVHWPKGGQTKTVFKGTEPKGRVVMAFHGPERYSKENQDDMETLGEVLSIRLREQLREELGGVYGVGAGGFVARRPRQEYTFSVGFGCAPDNIDALRKKVLDEVAALQKNGIGADYLDKVKQGARRSHEINLKENGFWERELEDAYRYGEDPQRILDIEAYLARITSERVQASARRYLKPSAVVQGILKPESASPAAAGPTRPATQSAATN